MVDPSGRISEVMVGSATLICAEKRRLSRTPMLDSMIEHLFSVKSVDRVRF